MGRVQWEESDSVLLDKPVLYLDSVAVPWNGLVFVDELEDHSYSNDYYMEPRRVRLSPTSGDQKLKITAFTFPDEFSKCCGYARKQWRQRFGLSYRSFEDGFKTHLVYGCLVEDDNGDERLFRWDISAPKIQIPGAHPSASLTVSHVPQRLEEALYGTDNTDPYLPSPAEVISLCLQ